MSDQADELSYDDMSEVGVLRLAKVPHVEHGDDLNDAPFVCNGGIYSGERIVLKKGDWVIVVRSGTDPA